MLNEWVMLEVTHTTAVKSSQSCLCALTAHVGFAWEVTKGKSVQKQQLVPILLEHLSK